MKKKQIVINQFGDAETLDIETSSFEKICGDDEVIIDVHYSGINFADIVMRIGLYRDAPKTPFVPGYEVSGTIAVKGKHVTRFEVGEEVMAGTRFGGYCSHITLPAWQVIKKPAGLDLKQAAALPVNFLTAYIAINDITRVRSGDNVLLDCASGGVGVMAMQILSKLGANTIGLTSSPQKKEFIESYGAQAITWDEFENNQTKFDVVLNSSGGKTLMDHFSRLRKSGHLVCFGVSAGIKDGKRSWLRILKLVFDMPRFHILKLLQNNKSIGGLNVLYYFDDHEWMKSTITEIEKCDFIPHVDSVFAYKDVSKAHKWIETKKAKGKVLLDWTELHL